MEKTKKILIFSTAYYPFVGGAEVAVKEITDRIYDIQFDLITAKLKSGLPKVEKIGNVNVYRVGFGLKTFDKLLLPFWGAFKAIKLNNKNNYNFYWGIMASFGSGAAYLANIFSSKKVPIILNLQEGDSEIHFAKRWFGLINFSWKMALKRTSKLTVLSNFLADRARRFGYRGEIKIIPNGVDIEKFSMNIDLEEKNKIRESIGLKDDDFVLVTASRLVEKNGVGDVIKSLENLKENIKFLIMGEGPLEKKLKQEVKNLNLEKRVIFKGYVSHDEMPKMLKSCDIFIRPSLSEGFGNSFIEAMAVGIPVIATPVGGIPDFLKDPSNTSEQVATGYFCEPENPESIADKVMEYVNNPELTKKINENAHKMVLEKYSWNLVSKQMHDIFNS